MNVLVYGFVVAWNPNDTDVKQTSIVLNIHYFINVEVLQRAPSPPKTA